MLAETDIEPDIELGKPAKTVWFELAHPATPALPPS